MEGAATIHNLLLPDKYKDSPNKDRSLDNITFKDIASLQKALVGEIKPQNEKDFDMMFPLLA